MHRAVLIACGMFLIGAPLWGATLTVNLNGGADFTDIQSAIDAAADGDTVLVKPGEYVIAEPIDFNRLHDPEDPASPPVKDLVVRSEGGAVATTIRMSEAPTDPERASVVVFDSDETARSKLEGFTITGGRGTGLAQEAGPRCGGGVLVAGRASPVIKSCNVARNHSSFGDGGGVACLDHSAATFINSTISRNGAFGRDDSGVAGGGLYCAEEASPLLVNCVLLGNGAEIGGGVACDDRSSPRLVNCTVVDNSAWACPNGAGDDVAALGVSAPRLTNCIVGGSPWSGRCDGLFMERPREALFVPREEGGLRAATGLLFGEDGLLYVCSGWNGNVLRFDAGSGAFVDEFASGQGWAGPQELAYGPDGNVYISTSGEGCAIRRHDAKTGVYLGDLVSCGADGLEEVTGFLFRDRDGSSDLLVSNGPGDNILRYDGASGRFLGEFVRPASGGLGFPRGLTIGPDGNLYVCSHESSQILRYAGESGEFLGVFAEIAHGGDQLCFPRDLLFGADGELYLVSDNRREVARYDGATGGFLDVFASEGGMGSLSDVTFGPDGNLYVADDHLGILRYDGTTGVPLRSPLVDDPVVTYSCVGGSEVWPGTGNIALDPLFVRERRWSDNGTPDDLTDDFWVPGDYHLQPGSPARDAGGSEAAPATDIEGNARPCGAGVDIGAYEFGECPVTSVRFHRSDTNADGALDVSDPVATLGHLFLGTEALPCLDAGDADDSGALDVTDAIYSLNFLFAGGPAPPAPFGACGLDETADALGCDGFAGCP